MAPMLSSFSFETLRNSQIQFSQYTVKGSRRFADTGRGEEFEHFVHLFTAILLKENDEKRSGNGLVVDNEDEIVAMDTEAPTGVEVDVSMWVSVISDSGHRHMVLVENPAVGCVYRQTVQNKKDLSTFSKTIFGKLLM